MHDKAAGVPRKRKPKIAMPSEMSVVPLEFGSPTVEEGLALVRDGVVVDVPAEGEPGLVEEDKDPQPSSISQVWFSVPVEVRDYQYRSPGVVSYGVVEGAIALVEEDREAAGAAATKVKTLYVD